MERLKNVLKDKRELVAFFTGIIIVVGSFLAYDYHQKQDTTYYDDEVHVHSDLLVYINGQRLDLTADKYRSSSEQILHKNFHLHDNLDNVIHRHADGLTLATFFSSLGFTLTNDCFTTDEANEYCSDAEKVLRLYVNGVVASEATAYIPQETDQILLYYGVPDDTVISSHLEEITDEACIYSGTCPERGIPPPESCGLTCEI